MGKYRVDALIGLGGMGAVYCVEHLGIDRRVAFKILQPNIAMGDEQIERMFEREAKLSGRLRHENIVDVLDAGQTPDGLSYIVMEWLEGHTLEEELAIKPRLGFSRAAFIARQIASALADAHRNQIIHRDLKPGNVMLVKTASRGEIVKVLDFGISKAIGSTAAPVSAIVGTPHYASLEQLTLGETIDGRSDLYSLGVILYRALSGEFPFDSNTLGGLIQQQLTVTPPPLRAIRPETPPALEELVGRMISRNPAERPANAAEVIATLDRIVGGLPDDADLVTNELRQFARTGETTIQRRKTLEEEPTEVIERRTPTAMPAPSPTSAAAKIDYSTVVMPQARTTPVIPVPAPPPARSPLLLGSLAVITLAAGGYGVYRYAGGGGAERAAGVPPVAAIRTPTPIPATPKIATSPITPAPLPRTTPEPKAKPKPTPAPVKTQIPKPAEPPPPTMAQRDFQRAEEHYRSAESFYAQNRFRLAIRESNQALRLNPNHAGALEVRRKALNVMNILRRR
jgi:serine/threonine protein kinase